MTKEPESSSNIRDILEIYKMLVEMADRVSQRRQSANSFYLTVNTAIISGAAYISQPAVGHLSTWAISIAGIAICALWIRAVTSYKSLNSAKFDVITAIEKRLPVSPYSEEWNILDVDGDGKRHKPFHKTELLVPIVFMCVHGVQILVDMPWTLLISCLSRSS